MNGKQLQAKLEELLGGLTVIRMADGFKVRRKRGPKRDQVLKAPEFENTRGSLADFVNASRAGKTLRNSLRESLCHVTDNGMYNRLTSLMCKVLKSDIKNPAGSRSFHQAGLSQLRGFEFNGRSALGTTLMAQHKVEVDRRSGDVRVSIGAFNPSACVYAPPGATHFVLHSSAAAVDFHSRTYTSAYMETNMIPVDSGKLDEMVLRMQLPASGSLPMFAVLGIYFVQEVRGVVYPLTNNSYNSLVLVAVNDETPGAPAGAQLVKTKGVKKEEKRTLKVLLVSRESKPRGIIAPGWSLPDG